MAEFLKILGQSAPTAGILTDVYTVPAGRSATISSVTVCNENITTILFRVSLAIAGAVDASKQYIYFDLDLNSSNTFVATVGITLGTGDVVRVQSDTNNVAFQFFGVEVA